MAEVLLRQRFAEAGIDARVSSAGLMVDGAPASGGAHTAAAERGLDLSGHRSRRMAASHLAAADLVVGMAREHVREAVVLERTCFDRAFTLRELVARAERHDPRGPDEPIDGWLRRIGSGRRAADLVGAGPAPDLDIADPIGGPLQGYRRTAAEIDDLLGRLLARGWPDAAATDTAAVAHNGRDTG